MARKYAAPEGAFGSVATSRPASTPLLRAQAESEPDDLIGLLNEHAAPIIKGILNKKLRSHAGEDHSRQEAEDLYSEVVVQLLARIRIFIANPKRTLSAPFTVMSRSPPITPVTFIYDKTLFGNILNDSCDCCSYNDNGGWLPSKTDMRSSLPPRPHQKPALRL